MLRARGRYAWYRPTDGMIAEAFQHEQEPVDMLNKDIMALLSLLHC